MSQHTNIVRIKAVANVLGQLKDKVVFVGGATVSLYPDRSVYEVRPTDDVDVIVEILNYRERSKLEDQLRDPSTTDDFMKTNFGDRINSMENKPTWNSSDKALGSDGAWAETNPVNGKWDQQGPAEITFYSAWVRVSRINIIFEEITGAGAGMAVAGALGKTAAATVGGRLLVAGAGGFAGGFVGGAINAAENGGDIWRGALLGGAIGAGSAVVMAAGVYGVKAGYQRAKYEMKMRSARIKAGYSRGQEIEFSDESLNRFVCDNFEQDAMMRDVEGKWNAVEKIKGGGEGQTFGNPETRVVDRIEIARTSFKSFRNLYHTVNHEFSLIEDITSGTYQSWITQGGKQYAKYRSEYKAYGKNELHFSRIPGDWNNQIREWNFKMKNFYGRKLGF
jgi:hypothetical protein